MVECNYEDVDKRILEWLIAHKGKIVSSPRNVVFNKHTQDFEIIEIDEKNERVRIHFEERNYPAMPLTFIMFDRAIEYISENRGKWVRLGTSFYPQPGTIEGAIWRKPHPNNYKSAYKVASHICDILALANIVEYGFMKNPLTGRKVQGVRYIT